jgi:hypothetical protein
LLGFLKQRDNALLTTTFLLPYFFVSMAADESPAKVLRRRLGSSSLPELSEVALLHYLGNHNPKIEKFHRYAKGRESVFGSYVGTESERKLRVRVQQRLYRLTKKPARVRQALRERHIQIPAHFRVQSEEGEEEEEDVSGDEDSTQGGQDDSEVDAEEAATVTPKRQVSAYKSLSSSDHTTPTLTSPRNQPKTRNTPSSIAKARTTPSQTITPNKMSSSSNKITSSSVEFDLHIEKPWLNPDGILALQSLKVIVRNNGKKYSVTKLSLYVPIVDVRDFQQDRYSASITKDGSTIELVLPSIATFFVNNPTKFQKRNKAQVQTVTAHQELVAAMRADPSLCLKTMSLVMPNGACVNNAFFNDGKKSDYDLVPNVTRMAIGWKHNGEDFDQEFQYVYYEMVVDGSEAPLEHKKSVDELAGIFKSKLKVENEDDDEDDEDDEDEDKESDKMDS